MKILIAGDFHSEIHEKAFYKAFRDLGKEVYCFSWHDYFKGYTTYAEKNCSRKLSMRSIYYLAQNKYLFGPVLKKINRDLIHRCHALTPDLVFIYRGTHILPDTLKRIRRQGCKIFAYNNDDPFSSKPYKRLWHHYLKGLFLYDWIFAYRSKNTDDYHRLGLKNTSLLRSYYIQSRNYPLEPASDGPYRSDVIFIGHHEDDDRDLYLKKLFEQGIQLKIYGVFWEQSPYYNEFLKYQKIKFISYLKETYNLGVNSCKIALVFLSQINSDTYTRRCFEIPATRTFMLSQYTDDLASLFKEGVEAEYFRSKEELVDKVKYYLAHDRQRQKIAHAGYEKVIHAGHEVTDRAKQVLTVYNKIVKAI